MVRFAKEDRLAQDEDLIRALLNRIENAEETLAKLTAALSAVETALSAMTGKVEAVAKASAETANNEKILTEWMNGDEDGN